MEKIVNEVIPVASVKNLSFGNRISPQLPLLIITDIIYDYFMEVDNPKKNTTFFKQSLESLNINKERRGV